MWVFFSANEVAWVSIVVSICTDTEEQCILVCQVKLACPSWLIVEVDSQNNFIDNIPIATTLEDYLKNIEVGDDYRVEVNLGDKKFIPTGSTTKIYKDEKVVIEFINIVRGDVNKDGSISALDYVKVKNHIMKTSPISDKDILLAADANSDNNISALDYVRIKNIILSKQK